MIDSIIKISGNVLAAATSDGIAALDIPEDSEIISIGGGIMGEFTPIPAAATSLTLQLAAELSFMSTNQIGVNDSRGSIAGIVCACCLFAMADPETGSAGGNLSEFNSIAFSEGIGVNAGERIFLHGFSNTVALTATATFMIYLKTKGGGRRSAKRR